MKFRKKGQEEIVGFVMIVVLIAIVMVIILGISLRKGSSEGVTTQSGDAYNFLDSAYTANSDCVLRFIPDYATLGELLEECYSGSKCLDGRTACEVFNQDFRNITEKAWDVSEEGVYSAYSFSANYASGNSTGTSFLEFSQGNCTGTYAGATYLIPSFPGRIESVLRICKN